MCGICGSVGIENGEKIVKSMTSALVHRGPDGEGYLDKGAVQFGMRRLAIIDLNTGDQPIYNEDHRVAVVMNGEIYNFRELRAQLELLNHQFRSSTDTEVIVHAFEQWGIACVQRFRGMFSIAIFDQRAEPAHPLKQRIYLVRDRLGIKPLYYWQHNQGLLFSSEVRSLLASGLIQRRLDPAGVYTYLAYGSVQEPLTTVQGVRSIPPASWLMIDVSEKGLEISQHSYWDPPSSTAEPNQGVDVRDWLLDSVGIHLVSDVPLGAFLSGGLDSGTITALSSQVLDEPLRTFTLGFKNWPSDERELADLTAQKFATNHQVRIISEQDILADLPQALDAMDQPTLDGVNSWYVSREVKASGLTVALSGVGGDELFAGYASFRYVPLMEKLPFWTGPLVSGLAALPILKDWISGSDFRRKVLAYLEEDFPITHPYFAVRGLFTSAYLRMLLSDRAWKGLAQGQGGLSPWRDRVRDGIQQSEKFDQIAAVSWLELTNYMRSTLLRDTDMMSMAHSLEVRVPFVDHILVEKILGVPAGDKMQRGVPKPLLARSMADDLPPEILREPKRTFTFPFQNWLQESLGKDIQRELLSPELPGILDPHGVRTVWDDFSRGKTNWARPWSLYVLQKWIRSNL